MSKNNTHENLYTLIFATRTSNNSNEKRGKIITGGNFQVSHMKVQESLKEAVKADLLLQFDKLIELRAKAGLVKKFILKVIFE